MPVCRTMPTRRTQGLSDKPGGLRVHKILHPGFSMWLMDSCLYFDSQLPGPGYSVFTTSS